MIINRPSLWKMNVVAGFVMALVLANPSSVVAGNTIPTPLDAWYEALQEGEAEEIDALLSDDAIIELKDLGIEQSKEEFVDSLDQWQELNADAVILTRLASASEKKAIIEVCYRFKSNEVFNRETFTLEGALILSSIQEKLADKCVGFE